MPPGRVPYPHRLPVPNKLVVSVDRLSTMFTYFLQEILVLNNGWGRPQHAELARTQSDHNRAYL